MSYAKRLKEKGRIPPFVPLTWEMLNSAAYIKLSSSAAKALPFFLGKVKVKDYASRYTTEFSFPYREALRLGFHKATHFRSICKLVEHGFLDPCRRGGMKGLGYSCSEFKLSGRWLKFGTPEFVRTTPWKQVEPDEPKTKATLKMRLYSPKNETVLTKCDA